MRFHIVGLGPIGCLVAFHLRRSVSRRHSVGILHKNAEGVAHAREKDGVIRVETQGTALLARGFDHQTFDSDGEISNIVPPITPQLELENVDEQRFIPQPPRSGYTGSIDTLIVCTKAHHSVPLLRSLLPRLSPDSTVVLLQNGMGVYEHIIQSVFPNPAQRPHFIVTVNSHGGWLKEYMHVIHAGIGSIKLAIMPDTQGRDYEANPEVSEPLYPGGPPQSVKLNLDDICARDDPQLERYLSLRNTIAALSGCEGLHVTWRPLYDVLMSMRRKVVVNSVINPLTALLGCRNGQIFSSGQGRKISYRICDEASAAFRAQWKREQELAAKSDPAFIPRPFPKELFRQSLEAEVARVASVTSSNFSSTLMDIRHSRPTELEYFNGYLAKLGKRYSVAMPVNSTIYDLLNLRSSIPLGRL